VGDWDGPFLLIAERQAEKDARVAADIYTELRNMVLTTRPEALGLRPADNEIWGVMMETGFTNAVVTLVALADGTASVYLSNGGGTIGLGPKRGPGRAGKELIALAQQFVVHAKPTSSFPLPQPGFMRFYLLSGNGVLAAEANANDLAQGGQSLSPLFYKGQELLYEIRMVEEENRVAGPHSPTPNSK